MATSLSEQLKRLSVPQSKAALVDGSSKASLLFNLKEAATKDRRTIYDIGVSGLQELITLNTEFKQFQTTLFNEATINMERSVEQTDINALLNKNITKFLQHLSPYLLLKPALMCLEWLLRRFQIHQYNQKQIMALILPYHETNVFVKVLQIVYIRSTDAEWEWLLPLAKRGVPLSKTAIVNRASVMPSFFNFICQITLKAIKELGTNANQLQTQINFYTTVIVGALQNTQYVQEWHISTLLESLLKGLGSDKIDFVSSSYIIVSQLVSRTKLKPNLCNALVERVANCCFERLYTTALLLLIWIFDTQTATKINFKKETLLNLVRQKWLTIELSLLAKENIPIQALCKPLLQGAVKSIQQKHPECAAFKQFLDHLLFDVELSKSSAEDFIDYFLDAYITPTQCDKLNIKPNMISDNDIIELNSDDETGEVGSDFQSWYSDYLLKLERQYPAAFDNTIKRALHNQKDKDYKKNRAQAIRLALGFRLKLSDNNTTNIYEGLYHYNAEIRLHAVKTILKNIKNFHSREQNYHLLKECLVDRINDDSLQVQIAILKLPTKDITEILGVKSFVEALFRILSKTQFYSKMLQLLRLQAVQHLTAPEVINFYDRNLILLALMPILFPDEISPDAHNAMKEILGSIAFQKNFNSFRTLKVVERFEDFNLLMYKQNFLDVVSKQTLDPFELLHSVGEQGGFFYIERASQLTHLLLLLTACLKRELSAAQSLQIYRTIVIFAKNYEFKTQDRKQGNQTKDFVPLQLYSDFVRTLVTHTGFGKLSNWSQSDTDDDLKCAIFLMDTLSSAVFDPSASADLRLAYANILKESLDSILPNAQIKIEFLLNFYVYEVVPERFKNICQYTELRVRAFKLLQSVLRNELNVYQLRIDHLLKLTCSLSSLSKTVRLQTIEILKTLAKNSKKHLDIHLSHFVNMVLARQEELSMDPEQFALLLYTILQPAKVNPQAKAQATQLQREILQIFCDQEKQSVDFIVQLLETCKHVNNADILFALLPLAKTCLEQTTHTEQLTQLKAPYNNIFHLIVQRFDYRTVDDVLSKDRTAWKIFESAFAAHDVFTMMYGKLQPVPCVILASYTSETFEAMSEYHKNALLQLIINTMAQSDNDSIYLDAHKLLKNCVINCKPMVANLSKMFTKITSGSEGSASSRQSKRKATTVSQIDLGSLAWKEGIAFLELLENKKYLTNSESLITTLFDLLKACLEMEEQSAVEYPKQLILSMLLHCCRSAQGRLQSEIPDSSFRIEQVVQCLRATQNPQTQQLALLFLSHCAALYPQQVLHNIVAIFTFMGSSVVRHDDAFSFHIINNIIESIVPILVQSSKTQANANSETLVIPVLKVFSDIMLDVPEHRRLPLYTKFLETLGATQHLWQFLCVVFEMHVLEVEKQRLQTSATKTLPGLQHTPRGPQRIEFAQELTNYFEPSCVIECCVQLLKYLIDLPLNGEQKVNVTTPLKSAECTEITLFDIKVRTSKHLRHYKYITVQFVSNILNSSLFMKKIEKLTNAEVLSMKPYYQDFIIETLSYVAHINQTLKLNIEPSHQKFWKVILHHVHDVLENAISLLTPEMFLLVVDSLMKHELLGVRKKVIELLITKLQQKNEYFGNCADEHFEKLFLPLNEIIISILSPDESIVSNDLIYIQQTSLIAVKLLSKHFGQRYMEQFKTLLVTLTKITKKRNKISGVVVANVVLTLIEISSNLKAHSLAYLPKYMPQVLDILRGQAQQIQQSKTSDNVCIVILAGIQKLFESLPLFLGPYIVDIIIALTTISSHISFTQQEEKDHYNATFHQKISTIWSEIAVKVPLRVLVPCYKKSYNILLETNSYDEISVLIKLLSASIKNNNNAELGTMQIELSEVFLQALEFRFHINQTTNSTQVHVDSIESHIIEGFISWTLKLSESSFRPMYAKVYDWAFKSVATKETMLTYFLLTSKIADALKSLFVLFANDFIDDAARLLNECNIQNATESVEVDRIHGKLIMAILSTLGQVFLHDNNNFVNSHRFQILAPAIVDQLENKLVLGDDNLQQLLTTCIAQLAVSVSNDILWKELNHRVLLKTRSNESDVRIYAFKCCVEIARKLGEDFSPLLPETVPFVAELLEDENSLVEKNARKSVQELEQILGESLQKYF